MPQLHVDHQNAQSATVPVRWCINSEAEEELRNRGVDDPFILLIVRNAKSRSEQRWVVPIGQLVQFVPFTGPGENTIFATIIYTKNGRATLSTLKKKYLAKRGNKYRLAIYNKHGLVSKSLRRTIGRETISVDVDKKFFAGEPNRFEKWWVNFWFKSKPVNQCAFRKRRILAYTIQWPVIIPCAIVLCVVRLIVASLIAIFLVKKDIGWKAIFRPWKYSSGEIWWVMEDYEPYDSNIWLHLFGRPVSWVILGIIYLILFETGLVPGIWSDLVESLSTILKVAWVMLGVIAVVALGMLAYTFIYTFIGSYIDRQYKKRLLSSRLLALKARLQAKRGIPVDSNPLTCGNLKGASIDILPAPYRTFRLCAQRVLARVCKPFAA